MPAKNTMQRAMRDKRSGKAASTQAGEFVREEIHHIRQGKHGARSAEQAIAIGLSKARRAGVDLPAPKKGAASEKTRRNAKRAHDAGQAGRKAASPGRSRGAANALKREPHAAASREALARQARTAAGRRSSADRSAAARKAAVTKGAAWRTAAALKAGRAGA